MRLAGEFTSFSDDAIEKAKESIARQGAGQQLIASEHIDLNTGRIGHINDGDPKSYLYGGNDKLEKDGAEYANPIQGRPTGSKQIRNMTPQELQQYGNTYEQYKIREMGTGNWANSGQHMFNLT